MGTRPHSTATPRHTGTESTELLHRTTETTPPTHLVRSDHQRLKPTLLQHNIETPINKNSLNTLRDLASNKTLWRVEVTRCMKWKL